MEKQVFINNEPTYYYITDDGRLYSRKTNNWYKGSVSAGYLKYDLRWGNRKYSKFAHRLVAEAYIDNPDNLEMVNHIDGNKNNNHVSNLEWVTCSQNNQHAYDSGLKKKTNGLTERQIYDKDLEGEDWKQYKDTTFMISNLGRIRNNKTGNLLKGKITAKGYIEWCLSINGVKKSFLAHRLVFETFVGELKPGYVINHKDGNKSNNNIENLEQILPSANIKHSYYNIGHKNVKKVGKFDMNNNLLDVYPSCAEAARQNVGTYPNLICNVCNGRKNSHAGYIWKYLDE